MAAWVRVTAQFDYQIPGRRIMISYPAGYIAFMPNETAKSCVNAARGFVVPRPEGAKTTKRGEVRYGGCQ